MVKIIKVTFRDPMLTEAIIVRHKEIQTDQGDRKHVREEELEEREALRLG